MSNENKQADERAAFETWAKSKSMNLTPFGETYDSDFTSSAWEGWQARATQQATKGDERVAGEPKCFAADGKTPVYPVTGLGLVVKAGNFNALYGERATTPSSVVGSVRYEVKYSPVSGEPFWATVTREDYEVARQNGSPVRCTDSAAPCQGMNCGCTNGVDHSPECLAEHAAKIAGGRFVAGSAGQAPISDATILDAFYKSEVEILPGNSNANRAIAAVRAILALSAATPSRTPVAWEVDPVGGVRCITVSEKIAKKHNGRALVYADAHTAPSLTTDAGAVLTDEQRDAIVLVATKHISDPAIRLQTDKDIRALLAAHPEQRMSDAAPTFEGKHVALKQHGAKLTLTIELDAIEGAPRYRVTPINPAVARKAEIERSGGDA